MESTLLILGDLVVAIVTIASAVLIAGTFIRQSRGRRGSRRAASDHA